MAKKTTVSTGEWAKHLRPTGKREFWKKDRKAGKKVATAATKFAAFRDGLVAALDLRLAA